MEASALAVSPVQGAATRTRRLMRILRQPRPLTRAVLELVNAVNAYRPLAKGYAALGAFWFGWPTSEEPLIFLGASAVDAVRRGRRGDFAGRRGKAAMAITAVAWSVLLMIYRRDVTTPAPVLHKALEEGLGPDYLETVETLPPSPSRTGRPSAWRSTSARRRYVKRDHVIRYGPHGRANLADVWRRRDLPRDGKAPVLVQVPGGAWMLGWRRPQAYPLMAHMADRGWVCVSLNYRVSPLHRWPAHIIDVKRALAWVKEHIAEYGGDPDFVAITGGSAGGHLAALAALTPSDPRWQPGFEHADTSVAAAVPVYGRYDWYSKDGIGRPEFVTMLEKLVVGKDYDAHEHVYRDASPIDKLTPHAPPFFVLHGEHDSLIPVGEAREFARALREVSHAPVAYAELPGAQHAFDVIASPRAHRAAEAVAQFLSWVYATSRPR